MINIFRPTLCKKKLFSLNTLFNSCARQITTETPTEIHGETKRGGYAKALEKIEAQLNQEKTRENKSFAYLLRHSKFIDLGDPNGKIVLGKIFKVIDDDLYIDFGWKFYCVCPRPKNRASEFVRGAKVRILIKDLELSSKFLGYDKDITLLEADAVLMGLVQGSTSNN